MSGDHWNDPESYERESAAADKLIRKLFQYQRLAILVVGCTKYGNEGKACCFNYTRGSTEPCINCVTRHNVKECYVCNPPS